MATRTLPQLEKQIAALQRKADLLKRKEAKGVIARIKEAIAYYQLTPADLGFGGNRAAKTSDAAAPAKKGRPGRRSRIKYRDGAGHEWTGHGRRPKWFVDALAAGKTREDMAV
jgi:DNA-binding protein H-NS